MTMSDDELFEDGDDSVVIDMTSVEGQSFELVPAGKYNAMIDTLEYKLSKSAGKPMWAVVLQITDGPYAGRKLFANLSFSEKALPGTKASIQRFAPETLTTAFNPKKIADSGDLIGRLVQVKTKVETYEGEPRTKVGQIMAGVASSGFED